MKEKKDCKIIQDLLPNYIEKLTNEETNNYIEDHLDNCNDCNRILENMKKDFKIKNTKKYEKKKKYIKKFSDKLKILKLVILVILATLLIVITCYYFDMRNAYLDVSNQLYNMVDEGMYPDTFYATIEGIYDTENSALKSVKVKGLDINDKNHREEYYFDIPVDNVGDNFKIKFNESDISLDKLKVGQRVAIYNYGDVHKSEVNYLESVRMIIVLDDEL